jgi:hypothetical protein
VKEERIAADEEDAVDFYPAVVPGFDEFGPDEDEESVRAMRVNSANRVKSKPTTLKGMISRVLDGVHKIGLLGAVVLFGTFLVFVVFAVYEEYATAEEFNGMSGGGGADVGMMTPFGRRDGMIPDSRLGISRPEGMDGRSQMLRERNGMFGGDIPQYTDEEIAETLKDSVATGKIPQHMVDAISDGKIPGHHVVHRLKNGFEFPQKPTRRLLGRR